MEITCLVIGGGGREHALAWALSNSPLIGDLHAAPGNPGIADIAQCHKIAANDVANLLDLAEELAPDLIVIGPEAPLVAGLSDLFRAQGFRVFGPSRAAAQLESSKAFTKALCHEYHIPTAKSETVIGLKAAQNAIERWPEDDLVVKFDGLAAGKGVTVCTSREEAHNAAATLLAGDPESGVLVLEERLRGPEASLFVLCDGTTALQIGDAQDYKRAYDDDCGPNTGGMGAISPAPALTDEIRDQVMATIITPTLAGLAERGLPYTGVLFAGLILTAEGPKLIEYNCRFGDPECQALMPRLMSDLLPLLIAACDGTLKTMTVRWLPNVAVGVTLSAPGYPEAPKTGDVIANLESAQDHPNVTIFHAGTRIETQISGDPPEGQVRLLSSGGRVLSVVGLGDDAAMARGQAYEAVAKVDWPDAQYRTDIAKGI